jgi:hypothetical protein
MGKKAGRRLTKAAAQGQAKDAAEDTAQLTLRMSTLLDELLAVGGIATDSVELGRVVPAHQAGIAKGGERADGAEHGCCKSHKKRSNLHGKEYEGSTDDDWAEERW